MSSTTDPTPTLANALAGLERAAADAGLDSGLARTEGEALAATIAEPARGAYLTWAEQVGGGRGSEEFFAAAQRGRKWRAAPTSLLSELVVTGSSHAKSYADALAEVCQSATALGEHSMRAVGNASVAASAQQRSVLPPDPEPEPVPPPQTEEPEVGPGGMPAPETLLRFLNQVNTQQLKDQTERIRNLGSSFLFGRRDESEPGEDTSSASTGGTGTGTRTGTGTGAGAPSPSSGNPFDLSGIDPHAPGAFSGLPTPGDPYGTDHHAPTSPPASPSPAAPAPGGSAGRPSTPDSGSGAGAPSDPNAGATSDAAAGQPAATQTADSDAAAEPVDEPEPRSLDELLAELDGLIGLDRVKREIHRQVAVLKVEQLRNKAGLRSPTITRHLIFTGNPGTGKTTVARLVAGIYRALGLLSKGQLIEVDRSELVAGFLGQTAIKTSEVVESAVGGVLFIDEAYSLSSADDQYGQEAVDTLVKEMEDKRDDLVVIVAGYPAPMKEFIDHNPGLSSRFRTEIGFEDYDDDELTAIFKLLANNSDYDITDSCEKRFRMILGITPRDSTFGNGRFARNCLEAAIGRHAWRLRDVEEPTLADLRELRGEDLDDHDGEDPAPGDAAEDTAPNPLDVAEDGGAPQDAGDVPDTDTDTDTEDDGIEDDGIEDAEIVDDAGAAEGSGPAQPPGAAPQDAEVVEDTVNSEDDRAGTNRWWSGEPAGDGGDWSGLAPGYGDDGTERRQEGT